MREETKMVRDALQAIYDQRGVLEPAVVVVTARDASSPLHGLFEWDDGKAADLYRLEQARTLIRSAKIVVTTTSETFVAPAFVHDPSRQSGYVSVLSLRERNGDARAALMTEFGAACSALNRAKRVARALDLEAEVDELLAGIVEVRDRLGCE